MFDLHAKKIYGFAFWDLFLTFVGAVLLFPHSVIAGFIILFIIGEILHIVFNVETHFIKVVKQYTKI